MKFKPHWVIAPFLLAALPGSAAAHGIWIAEQAGKHAVVYGHGAANEAYDTAKLKTFAAFDLAGLPLAVTPEDLDDHVVLKKNDQQALLTATFDNGHWTKDTDGKWHNQPKTAVKNAVSAGHYMKYSKSVLDEKANTLNPVGHPLEIVTVTNPLSLKTGDTLSLQVLLNGTPASGAKVYFDYVSAGNSTLQTDKNGEVTFPIRNDGLNVIAASLDEKLVGNENADVIGHFATFSFAFGHSH